MHHILADTAAALAALTLGGHLATWRAMTAVDPYLWFAVPAVYAWCAAAIRTTLERTGA